MSEAEAARSCKICGTSLLPDANFCHKCGIRVVKDSGSLNDGAKVSLQPLYHIHSVVNNFRFRDIIYDNVKITWFVVGREKPQVPYDKAILKYEGLSPAAKVFPENFVKGLFTREEAEQLKKYLTTTQRVAVTVDVSRYPIGSSEMGYRDTPPGPGTNFIELYKKPNYNLPFRVEGVFDTRSADRRVVADECVTEVSRVKVADLKKYAEEKSRQDQGPQKTNG